jgi:hypothetical protein
MAVKRICREVGDPPALVRFDGTGLKTDGVYCQYFAVIVACATELVYFDGAGLKSVSATTDPGVLCPSVNNACDFDGTGLKLVNLSDTCKVPA